MPFHCHVLQVSMNVVPLSCAAEVCNCHAIVMCCRCLSIPFHCHVLPMYMNAIVFYAAGVHECCSIVMCCGCM